MSFVLLLCLGQRSAPIIKPLPLIHNIGIIRPSRFPVALAIAVLLDWVSQAACLLLPLLLPPHHDARLLLLTLSDDRLLLLGMHPRLAMGEKFDPALRLSLLL